MSSLQESHPGHMPLVMHCPNYFDWHTALRDDLKRRDVVWSELESLLGSDDITSVIDVLVLPESRLNQSKFTVIKHRMVARHEYSTLPVAMVDAMLAYVDSQRPRRAGRQLASLWGSPAVKARRQKEGEGEESH